MNFKKVIYFCCKRIEIDGMILLVLVGNWCKNNERN